jgi:hypothetical protein
MQVVSAKQLKAFGLRIFDCRFAIALMPENPKSAIINPQ